MHTVRPPMTQEDREQNRELVRPLFDYLLNHGISKAWLADRIGLYRRHEPFTRQYLSRIAVGKARAPYMFVEDACAVLEKTPEQVMGEEWCTIHQHTYLLRRKGA